VTTSFDCTDPETRSAGLARAQQAIANRQCIVLPTDTVYGIGADAFSPQAVATLLAAKGRGRSMPPPVLVPRLQTMDGLAIDITPEARALAEAFWPGGLTLIFHAQPSLTWDLGDTKGTVALRMPDDEIALDLLALTGPMAVSSANRTGNPAAQTAAEAQAQLAESVEVYLEAGPRPQEGSDGVPSTIVDATQVPLRVVRVGAVSLDELRAVVPSVLGIGEEPAAPAAADTAGTAGDAEEKASEDTSVAGADSAAPVSGVAGAGGTGSEDLDAPDPVHDQAR